MNLNRIVLILLTGIFFVNFKLSSAQVQNETTLSDVEQVKAELYQQASENRKRQEYNPQWQKDFEDLQLKVNEEMARNMRLNIEQKLLAKEEVRLKKELTERQALNLDLKTKLQEQEYLQDEQKWKADQASQEREYQALILEKNQALKVSQREIRSLEDKITVTQLKLKLMGVEDYSERLLAIQKERDWLEAQIISQQEKEKDLSAKIKEVKDSGKKMDPAVAQLKTQIDALREDLRQLEKKQNAMIGKSGPTPQENIEILTKQKEDLVEENNRIKAKIDKYKTSEKMGIENKRIKDLVEAISAVDSANNELSQEAKYLSENIIILKMRIKKLEYRQESMESIRGKNNDTGSKRK